MKEVQNKCEKKNKAMRCSIGVRQDSLSVALNGKDLVCFKFLGVTVTEDGTMGTEGSHRVD